MSSLLKKSEKTESGTGKIVGTVIVGLLVLGFFFLPEILSFGGSAPKQVATKKVLSEADNTQREEVSEDPAPSPELIDDLLSPIAGEETAQDEVVDQPQEVQQVSESGDLLENEQLQTLEDESREDLLIPVDGPITWEMLEKPEIEELLDAAQVKAENLYRGLDAQYPRSRYELISFLEALNDVKAADKNINPEDALLRLDYTDSEVSRALVEEGVPRSQKLQWRDTTIAPILRNPLSVRVKQQVDGKYNPQLTLMDVEVVHNHVPKNQSFVNAPVRVTLRGYVTGDDTKKIEWFIGKRQWEARKVSLKKPDDQGRRYFVINNITESQRRLVTVRAYSIDEMIFEKKYNFFPRVRAYKPYKKKGKYRYLIPYQPFDPRMDRAFLIAQQRFQAGSLVRVAQQVELGGSSAFVRF